MDIVQSLDAQYTFYAGSVNACLLMMKVLFIIIIYEILYAAEFGIKIDRCIFTVIMTVLFVLIANVYSTSYVNKESTLDAYIKVAPHKTPANFEPIYRSSKD